MPIGVVNAAIVEAAIADRVAFAVGVGWGGALADAVHATIAFAGVTHLDPAWARPLALVSAAIVVGYAALAWRGQTRTAKTRAHGFPTGLLLTLPNPAALTAWIAVAAMLPPLAPYVVGPCVGLGSAAWFTLLARVVARYRGNRFVRALPKLALLILVAIAISSAVRVGCS